MKYIAISIIALAAASLPAFATDTSVPAYGASTLPAVSTVNGNVEFTGGFNRLAGTDNFVGAIAGTISIPVDHAFGVQFDASAHVVGDDTAFGGAIHAFTRDPSSYLVGLTAAGVRTTSGNALWAIGPEAELYLDRVSIEAWAGIASLDYNDPALTDRDGFFAIGDIAWYATDNWRLSVGASYIFEEASFNIATEYQLEAMPVSLTGRVTFAENDNITATVGIKGYFGGPDNRTLMERHRQDDPQNRAFDLIGETSSRIFESAPAPKPTPPKACLPGHVFVPGHGCGPI